MRESYLPDMPFFTDKDNDLIREGSVRDPLGTQVIWTSIGRRLVPNLASAASRVEGLVAVMLIHYLCDGPLQAQRNDRFRPMFRLLEGLLEYHLFKRDPALVCFGKRSLEAGAEWFSVSPRDARTVVNGLYQYYRGTCRRAGILEADWTLHSAWSSAMQDAVNPYTDSLASLAGTLLDAVENEALFTPASLINDDPRVDMMLLEVLNSEQLREELRGRILGNPSQVGFARMCSNLTNVDIRNRFSRLETHIAALEEKDWRLHQDFADVMNSVGFLATLDTLFNLLQSSHGDRVDALAKRLQNDADAPAAIIRAAERFLRLTDRYDDARFTMFFGLARIASKPSELLTTLVEHHTAIVTARGHFPQVMLESELLIVPTPRDGASDDLVEELRQPDYGRYDYYTWVAGTVYKQLFAHGSKEHA